MQIRTKDSIKNTRRRRYDRHNEVKQRQEHNFNRGDGIIEDQTESRRKIGKHIPKTHAQRDNAVYQGNNGIQDERTTYGDNTRDNTNAGLCNARYLCDCVCNRQKHGYKGDDSHNYPRYRGSKERRI